VSRSARESQALSRWLWAQEALNLRLGGGQAETPPTPHRTALAVSDAYAEGDRLRCRFVGWSLSDRKRGLLDWLAAACVYAYSSECHWCVCSALSGDVDGGGA